MLSEEDSVTFLLARTDGKRRSRDDDRPQAEVIADDLGQLALALEQAGAYICQRRLTFEAYRSAWQQQHDKVLDTFDERLMKYPRSVATTWQTTVDQLGDEAKQLLGCLAWLGPEPIPESLLEVEFDDQTIVEDPFEAIAELDAWSLVQRSDADEFFSVHRLVQDVSRRSQYSEDGASALLQLSLSWLEAAFVGNPTGCPQLARA